MNSHETGFKRWVAPFIFAICVIAFFKMFDYIPMGIGIMQQFGNALAPFVLGAAIAYILNMPCKKINSLLQKINVKFIKNHSKGFSVILTMLFVFSIIYLVINAVVPILVEQVVGLARILQMVYERIIRDPQYLVYFAYFEEFFPDFNWQTFLSTSNLTQSVMDNVLLSIRNIIKISSSLFSLFISVVSSIYFLLFSDVILAFFVRLIHAFSPKKVVTILFKYTGQLNAYFYQYISCQIIDGIILGTAVTIGLSVLNVDYAILFGILLGVLNIIPYFGSIFGTLLTIIIIMFSHGMTTGITASIFLLITQQLDANVVQPKLLGDSFKLNPLFVISSISIGGYYYGILGMILALPIGAVLRNIVVDLMEAREEKLKRTV